MEKSYLKMARTGMMQRAQKAKAGLMVMIACAAFALLLSGWGSAYAKDLSLSQTPMNAKEIAGSKIGETIGKCIQRNWNLAALSDSRARDLMVGLAFKLNPDGTVAGEAVVTAKGGNPAERFIAAHLAKAALDACAPFNELPAEHYDLWKDVTVHMKAFPD